MQTASRLLVEVPTWPDRIIGLREPRTIHDVWRFIAARRSRLGWCKHPTITLAGGSDTITISFK